jgi:hypothetical protein
MFSALALFAAAGLAFGWLRVRQKRKAASGH